MRVSLRDTYKSAVLRNIALNYLFKKNKEFMLIKGNKRFVTFAHDYIGSFIAVDGLFERIELHGLISYLERYYPKIFSKVLIDVGANIGNHTVYFSDHFKRVVAFEAHPEIHKILSFNTSTTDNIEVYNIGLSDCDQKLNIKSDLLNMGASRIDFSDDNSDLMPVNLKVGDQVLSEISDIGVIKIDVEGMEKNVLRGLVKTIVKQRPIIIFEQHFADFADRENETEAISFLRNLGYEMVVIKISKNSGKNWFYRRINNLKSLLLGAYTHVDMELVSNVVPGSYPMIIAVCNKNF